MHSFLMFSRRTGKSRERSEHMREHRALRFGLLGGLLAALTCVGGAARADTPASPSDDRSTLAEVVVTANKREENTKDVPVSIGVVDGEEITALHIENLEDVSRIVPGVSFAAHNNGPNGPGQDNITIRGVSSTVGNPTVGIYIDEVPIITITGYQGDAEPRLIDIDRIEVLRGPQGTLYGASSEGGTIRFITKNPDSKEYSGWFRQEVSYTRHGGFNFDDRAVLNIPVVEDVFALRVSAEYGRNSGYIDRYALAGSIAAGTATAGPRLQRGVNSDESLAVNVKGLLTLSDDFTVTPAILYQRTVADDASTFMPAIGLYNEFNQVRGDDRDTLIVPSLTVKKGLAFADLTSVTGYVDRRVLRHADGTAYNSAAIAGFFLDTVGAPPYSLHQAENDNILGNIASPVTFNDHFNTWTQEFRLSSPAGQSRIKWVAGAFVADQQWSHLDYETAPGFGAAFQNIYGYNINTDPVLNPTVGGASFNPNFWANDLVWTVDDHNDVKQYALFGQVDIDILPTLHVGVGERYVWAVEKFAEMGGGFFDYGGAGTMGAPYTQSARFSTSTPKFTIRYDLTDQSSVYGSAGKGFRLGGATTPNTNAACVDGLHQLGYNNAPTTYGPDHLWSYELGSKNLLFEKTLSVNADVYYIKWKDIQQTITIPICGGAFNANVGDATAIGGEVEILYKPPVISGLTLGANLGGEHAYITSTKNASTAAVGQDVLYTPEYTATVTANYRKQLTSSVSAFVLADYEYTGKSFGSFIVSTPTAPNPAYVNPSYSVVNLNAGVTVGRYEFSLFAKNLLDNKTILQSPTINSVTMGYTLRPLTVGIALQAKFP
ncbi:MAG: tonB dependent receptor family protein [Gammaproteobacteria bacterium]|nr:tonB dependent receptor family protein [Gammaproteobacteria bacterium]